MASDTPKPTAKPKTVTPETTPVPEAPAVTSPPPAMVAAYLDMPAERRAAAEAHAALLGAAAAAVASELPLSADVNDFCRVLVAEAKS